MGKLWVLDTDTKGTGAQMVPLEKVLEAPAPKRDRLSFSRKAARPRVEPPPPEPRRPPRFKVVDVMTGRVLADGADARATVELLEGVRSAVDVTIHVWEEGTRRWRQLSHRERGLLWSYRGEAR